MAGIVATTASSPRGCPEKNQRLARALLSRTAVGTDPCATMDSVMESVVGSACIEIARAVRQCRPRPAGPSSPGRRPVFRTATSLLGYGYNRHVTLNVTLKVTAGDRNRRMVPGSPGPV